MSNEHSKLKKSERLYYDEVAINRQLKIAKQHGLTMHDTVVKESNRLSKCKVMDCGNPRCYLCGNPRKTHKDRLTAQEKRLFQELDSLNNKKGNGLLPTDND